MILCFCLKRGSFYLAGERMKAPQFFNSIRGKARCLMRDAGEWEKCFQTGAGKSGEEGWKAVWEKVLWGRVSE